MKYSHRIQSTIDYIEENLTNNITLEDLANKAFCSKFHYHRIFQAMVGEPVMEYIRKRRLMNSVELLLDTQKEIIDIALEFGFEYQQSYTRAFKGFFGFTPSECRRNRRTTLILQKTNLLGRKLDTTKPDFIIGPNIVEGREIKIAGIECLSTMEDELLGNSVVPKLWEKFLLHKKEIKNIINQDIVYGIGINDNLSKKLRYSACCEVNSLEDVPKRMRGRSINLRRKAIFKHLGTDTKIYDSFNYIFGVWLPNSEYELEDEIDMIVKFDSKYAGDCEKSEFEIIVALK